MRAAAVAVVGLLALGTAGCDRDWFFEPDDEAEGYYGSPPAYDPAPTSYGDAGDVIEGRYAGDIGVVAGVAVDEPRILYYLEDYSAHVELEGAVGSWATMVFVDTFDNTLSTLEPGSTYSFGASGQLMFAACAGPVGQGWIDELMADDVEVEVEETGTPGTMTYNLVGDFGWDGGGSLEDQTVTASFTVVWAR